ncbi:MAG: KEOPS complex subunit Cgi121 [Methanoregulaceae archaeon]
MQFQIRYATVTVDEPGQFLTVVREIGAATGTRIVLFDADRMAGAEHARSALRHAVRSSERGEMIARSLEMEALLYAAGSRQTRVGRTFGLHPGENRCYVALSEPAGGAWEEIGRLVHFVPEPDAPSPGHRERLCDLFGITPEELGVAGEDRLYELVLERVALLDATR